MKHEVITLRDELEIIAEAIMVDHFEIKDWQEDLDREKAQLIERAGEGWSHVGPLGKLIITNGSEGGPTGKLVYEFDLPRFLQLTKDMQETLKDCGVVKLVPEVKRPSKPHIRITAP